MKLIQAIKIMKEMKKFTVIHCQQYAINMEFELFLGSLFMRANNHHSISICIMSRQERTTVLFFNKIRIHYHRKHYYF